MGIKKILVADDWDSVRITVVDIINYLLKNKFERKDFEVDSVNCGNSALEYISRNKPEILITDIRMPPYNQGGIILLNKLNENGFYNLPKCIGIISGTVYDVEDFNLPAGYYDFLLAKPFEIEKISKNLDTHYFSKFK